MTIIAEIMAADVRHKVETAAKSSHLEIQAQGKEIME